MIYVIIAFFVFVGLLAGAILLLRAKGGGSLTSPKADSNVYYLRKSLFTPAERSFLGVLETLDLGGLGIASKVRLADIFGVVKGLERGDRTRAQNKINAKHVDFLLIQKSDGKPVLGIELDDKSHDEEDRAARDAFVDTVFASAGLPILHVPVKQSYDPKEVLRLLEAAVNK
jgi:very-short-patch-repair endonuclease